MKTIIKCFVILLIISTISCETEIIKIRKSKPSSYIKSSAKINQFEKSLDIETLFKKAIIKDSLESYINEPFQFFKSGKFLNGTIKEALLVTQTTDKSLMIKYYTFKNNKWILNDSALGIEDNSQFQLIFDDYNFDNQTDIFIQESASNGYSLSLGQLVIINPKNKKLMQHQETNKLANMKPDPESKTVYSEDIIYRNNGEPSEICICENKWINGTLKTMKKHCPRSDN